MPDLSYVADAFIETRRARPRWVPPLQGLLPKTQTDGYLIQAAVADKLTDHGIRCLGYKVGSASAGGQREWGMSEPVYGAIFEDTCDTSLSDALGRDYTRPMVECEIAVRLSRDLPAKARAEEVRAAFDWARLACEVIDMRPPEPKAVSVPTLLADGFFNAGFVLGPSTEDWRARDLARLDGEIEVNGDRFVGSSGPVLDPVTSVRWLAGALGRIGRGLKAGDIVLTGSLVPPVPVPARPQSLSLAIEGFGRMTLADACDTIVPDRIETGRS